MSVESCREKILSQDFYDFLIPDYRSADNIVANDNQACIQELGMGYRVAYVDPKLVGELTIDKVGYNAIPKCYTLLDTSALNQAGITAVQAYPTLQLSGRGIMIGFLDTGIDYTNPVFRNIAGETRIAGIWDQTIQTGNLPEGLTYGSEYTQEMINEALKSDVPSEIVPSVDSEGHGTFLASVAAGGASPANQFSGAAPEATIAMVKLKQAKQYLKNFYAIHTNAPCYQENDIMQGLKYLNDLATRLGMPLLICISLGTNLGGHNSSSILSRMLDSYADMLNRCVVIAGGNEASNRHHFFWQFTSKNEVKESEIRVERGTQGFVAELWNGLPNIVTAYLISPSGEKSPSISLRQGSIFTYNFVFDGTTVEVEDRLLLENSNSQLIFFRFINAAAGIWKIGVQPLYLVEGDYHIWLPVQEFLESNVYFLEANPDTTLTEPGSTQSSITIS